MDETAAVQFISNTLVTRATSLAGVRRIWRHYRRSMMALPAWTPRVLPSVAAPDGSLAPYLASVEADPAFQSQYSIASWQFAEIEIGRLLAFQPQVEVGRYEIDPGPEALATTHQRAEFCLPVMPTEPMSVVGEPDGTGKAVALNFSSARRTLMFSGFGQAPTGEWQWAILARPNHVVVCEYAGRYYVKNGYHRLVALLRMGYKTATVVLQRVTTWGEVVPPGPGFFTEAVMVAASRPPMLGDFTEAALAYPCRMRPTMTVLRIAFSEQRIPLL